MDRDFGPYQLLNLLGRGGMGEVYRAYDTTTDRVVALKLLPPHLAEDEQFQQRFLREARIAAGLNEPHVVPIHRYGEIDGRLYVDMRLIEGWDLQAVLAHGPIAPERAVVIVEQVAAALAAAHRAGLVHRDVKPSNILLTDRDFAYLIDFGIARAMDETSLTNTGQALGSIAYMSPERFATGQLDGSADVYALTCVLYECLTGQRAYPGSSPAELLAAHMLTPPPRPSSFGFPVPLDGVIATGMAKDPAARYRSPDELAHAARVALGLAAPSLAPPWPQGVTSAPTMLGPMPFGGPAVAPQPAAAPWWRRHPGLLGGCAAALVVAVVVTTTVLVTQRGGDAKSEPASAGAALPAKTTDIDELLLGATELNAILGQQDMVVTARADHAPDGDELAKVSPPRCDPAPGNVTAQQLDDAGVQQVRTISVFGPSNDYLPNVAEDVYQFPADQGARAFFEEQAKTWGACLHQDVAFTYPYDGGTDTSRFSELVRDDDALTVHRTLKEAPQGYSCQQALVVKGRFIVNARACSFSLTDQGRVVATRIADKIPPGARPAAATPKLPKLQSMMLDAGAVGELVGTEFRKVDEDASLAAPSGSDYAANPPGCAPLATVAMSTSYANIAWLAARRAELTPVAQSRTSPVTVNEALVLTASPQVAAKFLEDSTAGWQHCLNQVFRLGTRAVVGFVVRDVQALPNMVSSRSAQQGLETYACTHLLAAKGAYLVETHACGGPPPDVKALANQLMAKLPG